jgi:hypothetical protein
MIGFNNSIVIALFLALFTIQNQSRIPTSPTIKEQIEQRKAHLLDSTQRTYSHAEMWGVVEDFTQSLIDSSALYQSMIEKLLNKAAFTAYKNEREAFSEWYDYQSTVSSEVVIEIWQLFVGGTAGGTLEVLHLYDRANANVTEQEILYNALTKKTYAAPFQSDATMEQILLIKDSLIDTICTTYSIIDNVDNWRSLDHTDEEIASYISHDYALFQNWISTRSTLEANLDSRIGSIISSQTKFWIDLYLDTLKGRYIHETEL